jgi:Retrotransposon gag protein
MSNTPPTASSSPRGQPDAGTQANVSGGDPANVNPAPAAPAALSPEFERAIMWMCTKMGEAMDNRANAARPAQPTVIDPSMKMPQFKGEFDDTVMTVEWLDRAAAYFTNRHIALDDMERRTASLYTAFPMGSRSAIWLRDEQNKGGFATWGDFCTRFLETFKLTKAHRQRLEDSWKQYEQGNKTVSEYYNGLTKLISNLKSIDIEYTDSTVLTKFVDGLRFGVQSRVQGAWLVTEKFDLAKALEIAIMAENWKSKGGQNQNQNARTNSSSSGATGSQLRSADATTSQGNRGRNNNNNRLYCGYCKKHGHTFNNCRAVQRLKDAGKWEDRRPQQ